MRLRHLTLPALLLLPSTAALAKKKAAAAVVHECKGTTQIEMNQCAVAELKKSTDALARKLSSVNQNIADEQIGKLRKAEELWERWADAECEARNWASHDGTIYPMAYTYCRAGLARERITALDEMLQER